MPADSGDDQQASAETAARNHAEEAREAASRAKKFSERIEDEVKKIDADRRKHLIIALAQAATSVFLLAVIGYQAFQMVQQNEHIESSISLTREQQTLTRADMAIALRAQEHADGQEIEELIDDPGGIFQRLHETDPYCGIAPPIPPSDHLAMDRLVIRFAGHYESYYLALSSLGFDEDWQRICNSARRLRQRYCHLDNRLSEVLENVSQDFREAFEECVLVPAD